MRAFEQAAEKFLPVTGGWFSRAKSKTCSGLIFCYDPRPL
jgi:hypothetical protein